jgi:5-methylcytosine-specific restriction endonuclease McrA
MTYQETLDRLLDGICQAQHDTDQAQNHLNDLIEQKNQEYTDIINTLERRQSDATVLRGNDDILNPLEDLDYDSQQDVDDALRDVEDEINHLESRKENIKDDNKTSKWDRNIDSARQRLQDKQKKAVRREQRLRMLLSDNREAPDFETEDALEEHVDALVNKHQEQWQPDDEDEQENEDND